ncbi:uncharacterized protein LOC130442184 [Diorhabda sublineata]|uniref:uncharacterized protein LOC130442184 n=1 Tax=Diorhabda sublineata TaxID=1163346 RepID=UPI0024E15DCB|nr:uncharacterized protein LOC130442184 [Diorhabda sublineata]
MNKLVLTTILFAVLAFVNADSSSSSEEDLKEIGNLLKEKFNITLLLDFLELGNQAKAKCPDIEEKMDNVVEQMGECAEQIELGDDTFCSLIKKNLKKCSKPVIDIITSCMPNESKDLPSIIEKAIIATVEQACQSTVEEILELFNPCYMQKDFIEFQPCADIRTTLVEQRNKLPSKSLVCSTIPKMRNCMKDHLEASCQNAITKRSSLKFQDAIWNSVKVDCKA